MEASAWKMAAGIALFSILGSAFALRWYYRKHPIKKETVEGSVRDAIEPDDELKRWRRQAVLWPALCLIFTGIVIYQAVQGMEERVFDVGFILIPLIFFAVGMKMRRRLLMERRYAVMATTATVVAVHSRVHIGEGSRRSYFPEYEFKVGEEIYRVIKPSGYSSCVVKEKQQVELYYAPENPNVFYVPAAQRQDGRWSALLCGIGILYPLVGLCAPLIRALIPL